MIEWIAIAMTFLLKKVIGLLCMPLSLAGILLVSGMTVLLVTRRQALAKTLLALGTLVALTASWPSLADRMLAPLERRYDPLLHVMSAGNVRHVIVLGGGHRSDTRLPETGRLSEASLARLAEGIRLHGMMENGRLVFTGGAVFDPVPHARIMALAAISLGVDERDILMLDTPMDTAQEALAVSELLGQERFVLVTSASHMPRAMLLFRMAGTHPVAAPTHFLVKDSDQAHPGDYFPSAGAMRRTERAVYEYLGLAWARMF